MTEAVSAERIILSPAELREITGYSQPARQVDELRARGFWRARLGRDGVILERAHYDAVCAGTGKNGEVRPKLRAV